MILWYCAVARQSIDRSERRMKVGLLVHGVPVSDRKSMKVWRGVGRDSWNEEERIEQILETTSALARLWERKDSLAVETTSCPSFVQGSTELARVPVTSTDRPSTRGKPWIAHSWFLGGRDPSAMRRITSSSAKRVLTVRLDSTG